MFFFCLYFCTESAELRYQANNICILFFRISEPSPVSYMYGSMMNLFMHIFTMRMCGFEVNFCVVQMVFNSTAPSNTITSQPPKKSPFALDIYILGMWLCASITHNTALAEFSKFLIHPKNIPTGNPSSLQTLKRFTPIFERVIDHARTIRVAVYLSKLTQTERM